MSDLISRSALIAKIDNDIRDTENYICLFSSNRIALSSQLNTLKTYKAIIENQPTAFDTEKVVAELESKKEKYYKDFELATDTLDIMCYGNMSNVYGHAIEIVRRGGIE